MNRLGKLAYGIAFAVVLPGALAAWAVRLDRVVTLPSIENRALGILLAVSAVLLMSAAVVGLRVYGRGWPMSPYPPESRVTRGAYAVVNHPLYVGSVMLSAGFALTKGSAAALWIVTPVLSASCAAFVIGYENEATTRRFGHRSSPPLIRVPSGDGGAADAADRLSIFLLVFLPWYVAFTAASALASRCQPRSGWTALDAPVPIVPWTEIVYAFDYLFVLGVPLVLRTRRQLRDFAADSWIAIAGVTIVYLAIPIVVVPRPAPPDSAFTALMLWERSFGTVAAACPSFHAVWAAIAAVAYTRVVPRLRWLWWLLAVAIAVSCMTTGMHAVIDIIAAVPAAVIILSWRRLARFALVATQRIANSWREWSIGDLRFMSHGLYAAVGSFLGMLIVARLTGQPLAAAFVGLSIILGAALWAQLIEGSSALLRPFGYFGGVIGACIAVLFTRDPWLLFAAYGVAATVVQACGRLRCLVQGCCHGRPVDGAMGITYTHPRSRVTRLSELSARPLHATQLYSIAWNALMFVLLLRLWRGGAALQFVAGSYFILGGLGRFVEEHFRGEPQTAIVGGLHLYQWLSIACVIGGAALTIAGSTQAPPLQPLHAFDVAVAAGLAAITYFAYGVDFPRLRVRFARLV